MNRLGLDILNSKIKIEGDLVLNSGLHIGTGSSLETSGTDSPVIKDFYGRPYIPGSSFKGTFRSTLEAIIRGNKFSKNKLWCCNILSNENREKCLYREADYYIYYDGENEKKKKATELDIEDFILENSCHICRLFGSPHLASRVKFPDMPVLDDWDISMFEIRNGVTIDRDSETAKDGALYDFEVVPAGTRFKFHMFIENPENWEPGLILTGIDLFNNGYANLGGIKSRGLGTLNIDLRKIIHESAKSILGQEEPEIIEGEQRIQKKAEDYKKSLKDYINKEN